MEQAHLTVIDGGGPNTARTCRKGGCSDSAVGKLGFCELHNTAHRENALVFAHMRSLMIAQTVSVSNTGELAFAELEELAAQEVDGYLERVFQGQRKVFAA